jgi:hypothetical protein
MDRRVEAAESGHVTEPNLEAMERIVAEARKFEQSVELPQEDVVVTPRRRKKHRRHAQEEAAPEPVPEPVQEVEVAVEVPAEQETPTRRRHCTHRAVE